MQESLSQLVFDHIESRFYNDHKSFIDDLCDILNLQKSSVYKKVNGTSSMTLEDLHKLCAKYDISVDEIFGYGKQRIFFDFPALHGKVKNALDFLKPIHNDILRLAKINPILYYATKELPFFYYFSSFPLVAFKFHVFYNLNWKDEKFAFIKYDLQQYLSDSEFKRISIEISNHFMQLNTVEIWNINVLDNTLNQIRYFYESGLFQHDDDCILLLNELYLLLDKIIIMIQQKDKSVFHRSAVNYGNTEIYNNEIAHTNNIIYIESESLRSVYSTYDNPNFMRSMNPELCDYTHNWINKLLKSASPITSSNFRDQQNFHQILKQRIDKAKLFIENLIEAKSK